MNLQESIRIILKEETNKFELFKNFIYTMYENVRFVEYNTKFNEVMVYYTNHDKRQMLIPTEICELISDYTGLDVVPWHTDRESDNQPDFYLDTEEYSMGGLNESEDDKEKKIQKNLTVLRKLISMFDYSEVCDMWVDYHYEDDDYIIRSKMSTKNHNTSALEKEFEFLENSIKYLGFTNCYVFRPYYVEQCEDEIKYMNESEDKNQSLLSLIEENGLYELISSTGLHINEIEQKVGQFSREVLERFIIDVVKEHHTDIDEDGQTYILDLEEYFDVVPIGNNDYVVQLRVMYDKLFFLVDLYDEDEYGDLEYSSHEVEPSKNILYDNIYEIAGQLGFLLVKGRF